jgi:hypothetical protein
MRQSVRLALLFASIVSCASPARADLAGFPEQPPRLTVAQHQVLKSNPDLAVLAETVPWAVRQALSIIARVPKDAQTSGWDVNAADAKIVGRNPALATIHQASPEAAAELLALIREAASSRKGDD